MSDAGDEHPNIEGARTALVPPVNDIEHERETAEESQRPGVSLPPALQRMRTAPWVVAVLAVILVSTLLLMLADAQRIGTSATPRPTPTHVPTATVAPTPSPTPADGFQYYVDHTNQYLIQYPLGWVTDELNPGIQFSDDENSPGYQVQIVPASTATAIGPSANASDASAWVNYALDNLEKRLPQNSYARVLGSAPLQTGTPTPSSGTRVATATPTPAATATPVSASCALSSLPVIIGGQAWQTGGLLVTSSDPAICVQVYATVYRDKPYIITLSAYDDRFTAGNIEFFTPMLKSFQFLPQGS